MARKTVDCQPERRISSRGTYFHKRVLPVSWFGFVAVVTCLAVPGILKGHIPIFVLPILIGMIVFGYLLMRALIFDLVDEVYFDGTEFLVRNAGDEERINLSNVINVDLSEMTNPERITLTLRRPVKFGQKITFMAPTRCWRIGWHPIAKQLLAKVRGIDL